ncbi:MAG UNVERIFIED_CONTAM: MFS transporter [Rickettsiaceae bacterium]|jgi:MHS family proline/betaine transporter-like MFS transporter
MKKIVISGMVGNMLEWYDYALYAQFVPIIAKHFFPESELAEIMAMAVFAAGFFVRPLGAIVFGSIGDKMGRRLALVIGILTMAIPTAAIGLLPSYASIGITATILLAIIRLIQGFSLGGEFSGCIAYIVEHSPPEKRGLAGSAAFVSMCLGMLLGTLTAGFMSWVMTPEALFNWGWRIPFVAGLFIGLVGLYIRMNLSESPLYKAARANKELSNAPLSELVKYNWPQLLMAVAIYITVTAPFYTSTVYIETFMNKLGYTNTESAVVGSLILITMIIVFPLSAKLSDRIGRRPILLSGCILIAIVSYPMIAVLGELDFISAVVSQIVFAACVAFYMGPVPAVLVESFPTKVRFTGVALSYNLSAAIFGGTAPMVAMILERWTSNKFAIGYYLIILALFTLYFSKII